MKSKHREEDVYEAVRAGELVIEDTGAIWRVAKRGWDRWKQQTVTRPCPPVRAEHDAGAYLMIRVMFCRKRYFAQAHRLIRLHFHGPIPGDLTVNHKDGNKKNNHPSNLELATHSEQVIHALRTLKVGRIDQCGEKNAMSTLTANQVMQIWRRRQAGENLAPIARDFGIAMQTVSKIARRDCWTHLDFG